MKKSGGAERLAKKIVILLACLIALGYAAVMIGIALGWIGDPPST